MHLIQKEDKVIHKVSQLKSSLERLSHRLDCEDGFIGNGGKGNGKRNSKSQAILIKIQCRPVQWDVEIFGLTVPRQAVKILSTLRVVEEDPPPLFRFFFSFSIFFALTLTTRAVCKTILFLSLSVKANFQHQPSWSNIGFKTSRTSLKQLHGHLCESHGPTLQSF